MSFQTFNLKFFIFQSRRVRRDRLARGGTIFCESTSHNSILVFKMHSNQIMTEHIRRQVNVPNNNAQVFSHLSMNCDFITFQKSVLPSGPALQFTFCITSRSRLTDRRAKIGATAAAATQPREVKPAELSIDRTQRIQGEFTCLQSLHEKLVLFLGCVFFCSRQSWEKYILLFSIPVISNSFYQNV